MCYAAHLIFTHMFCHANLYIKDGTYELKLIGSLGICAAIFVAAGHTCTLRHNSAGTYVSRRIHAHILPHMYCK